MNIEDIFNHIASYEKKLNKPFKKGFQDDKLPPLYWKTGEEVPLEVIRYLFFIQKGVFGVQDEVAKAIYQHLDYEKAKPFASAILKEVQGRGSFYAKNKDFFTPLAMLGGDGFIEAVKNFSIVKKNATAPLLLGFNGDMKSARALMEIIQKFKTKYPNVRNAAWQAFDAIAKSKGMSRFELQDEMIPDFGFEGLFYDFEDTNGKTYRAFVGNDFKIKVQDESGKIRKSIPARTPQELKDHFKQVGKEIRTIIKQQKVSLENYMIAQRRWATDAWVRHFMQKPVMFGFTQTLLWGQYDHEGKLVKQFAVAQDQTLEDVEYDEVELEDDCTIGIIHALELDHDDIEAWMEYFSENNIAQPFPQLERPIYLPDAATLQQRVIKDYMGKKSPSIAARADKRGWRRGSVVDAGAINSYYKEFPNAGYDVFICTEDHGIGYNFDCVFGMMYFVKHGSVFTGSYMYNEPYKSTDPRIVPLAEVPVLLYSETIGDVEFFIK